MNHSSLLIEVTKIDSVYHSQMNQVELFESKWAGKLAWVLFTLPCFESNKEIHPLSNFNQRKMGIFTTFQIVQKLKFQYLCICICAVCNHTNSLYSFYLKLKTVLLFNKMHLYISTFIPIDFYNSKIFETINTQKLSF